MSLRMHVNMQDLRNHHWTAVIGCHIKPVVDPSWPAGSCAHALTVARAIALDPSGPMPRARAAAAAAAAAFMVPWSAPAPAAQIGVNREIQPVAHL